MRRVVWKFLIIIGKVNVVRVPLSAQVRLAGLDPETGGPAIWIELDPDAMSVERYFLIYRTGKEIDGDGGFPSDIHVGSLIDREYVWHVYERRA